MPKNKRYAVSFKKMAFLDTNFHINAFSCVCFAFNICIANYVFFLLTVKLAVYVKRVTNGNQNNKCLLCYTFSPN